MYGYEIALEPMAFWVITRFWTFATFGTPVSREKNEPFWSSTVAGDKVLSLLYG